MSDSNPYASNTNPYSSDPVLVSDDLMIRRVAIDPIDLLKRSYSLIGDQYLLFLGIVLTGVFLGSLGPLGLLFGPLMVGIYMCYIQREAGQQVEFGTLFKGFEYFLNSFVAILVIAGILMLMMIPLFIIFILGLLLTAVSLPTLGEDAAPLVFVSLVFSFGLIMIVGSALVTLPFIFAFPLIADRGLSGGQAVWIGWQGVKANFWGIGWFMFVLMAISMICAFMCYLPIFLFMPISMGAQFLLYREVFGPNPMIGATSDSFVPLENDFKS